MAFSEDMVERVWAKGRAMPDKDPLEWRKDECGAWMRRDQYGSGAAEFGWKIENVTTGESDEVDNLRPFHRRNSFDRSKGEPRCHVTGDRRGVQPTAHIDEPANREV